MASASPCPARSLEGGHPLCLPLLLHLLLHPHRHLPPPGRWDMAINKMATQWFSKAGIALHSTPRTKTPRRSSRRFLYSHDIFANPVSNHASRPLSQVKSPQAEAAQPCSTQLPPHTPLEDDDHAKGDEFGQFL